MPLKDISTSIYTFPDLIESQRLYIDKTRYIYRLIHPGNGFFFCARPRRFGKSLTISTLEAVFQGRRELFRGLYLEHADYDWTVHPVIHLDFAQSSMETLTQLKNWLCHKLADIGTRYGLTLQETDAVLLFGMLIQRLYDKTGQDVVVLIDEYDKPILEHMRSGKEAESFRFFLENFYQIIKGMAACEHFVFITGVTKFAKVSIFSKLNNLTDITNDPEYATMFGYTQEELEQGFEEYFAQLLGNKVTDNKGQVLNRTQLLASVKKWYDGFRFAGNAPSVYNPVSIGKFLQSKGRFRNYWFATGTPSFLLEFFRKQQLTLADIEQAFVSDSDFELFDVSRLAEGNATKEQLFQLMFQTGYLTINKEQSRGALLMYTLRFPNYEVEISFTEQLSQVYHPRIAVSSYVFKLVDAIDAGDTAGFIDWLREYLANIPYDIQIAQEKYYQSLVYSILLLCGADMQTEICTNKGRIDAVLTTDSHLYIIEFKLNQSAETGLAQIEEKSYTQKYELMAKEKHQQLHKLAINFSYAKDVRNITDWKETLSV